MRMAVVVVLFVAVCALLAGWRMVDHMSDHREMTRLSAVQPSNPDRFESAVVQDLPDPAQRFFRFAIAEGTPLLTVAAIQMTSQFSMGDKDNPKYMTMHADQVLALPAGFVWKARMRSGHLRLSGSDSATWTRFWLGGILPVARQGGTTDHELSAFGRYVAEAVFWTPAALLPGPDVSWTLVDQDTARVTVRHAGKSQDVDVTVSPNGQPTQVVFERWSNANPRQAYQFQSFGGTLSAFRDYQGFRLPTHVEAGNLFGSDDYFPFYIVDVDGISFPRLKD